MRRYMRDQFDFLGIKTPQRRALLKDFLARYGPPELAELEDWVLPLWALPQREYQYAALDLLERLIRRLPAEKLPLLEHLIVTKSWWDTVDMVASHLVGNLLARHPEIRDPVVERWRVSENFWLRRTTLLFQLHYKNRTDRQLLFALIQSNLESREFFIQKAIGWALREYSKHEPEAVLTFVEQTPLPALSQREALKWLKSHS
ncbi:MAG: DNA alkylation repair protein [Cyanobacteria bacterium Co-bin13]|nr:DNA alkylation repair protein [Cyanobacteria bacterium Co-bin13]